MCAVFIDSVTLLPHPAKELAATLFCSALKVIFPVNLKTFVTYLAEKGSETSVLCS